MTSNKSIAFFDEQFKRQLSDDANKLNPFEDLALPYLRGEVLDFGCGLGNLAFAAARRGCQVSAIDASPAAIEHIKLRAGADNLQISASVADLRDYSITGDYDCIVCIGLLMFFDCTSAFKVLSQLQSHVRPEGLVIINVLVEGTTYMDMFDPSSHCLFEPFEMLRRFKGWDIEHSEFTDFEAPQATLKRFSTVIARRPGI